MGAGADQKSTGSKSADLKFSGSKSTLFKYPLVPLAIIFLILAYSCSTADRARDLDTIVRPRSDNVTANMSKRAPSTGEEYKKDGAAREIEEIAMPGFDKAVSGKLALELEPVNVKHLALQTKPVMINVDGMPMSDFIVYAIGDALKVPFFMDEAVRGLKTPVTLRMTNDMSADKVLEIVVELMRRHGLLVGEKGGALYVLRPPSGGQPVDVGVGRTVPASPANIVQIVVLKYVSATETVPIVSDLYKTGISVKAYARENALMLAGPASAMAEVLRLIDVIDVPSMLRKKLLLTKLTYWNPDEFIRQITTILAAVGIPVSSSGKDPGVQFIQIKFLNSVLIIAPDADSMKFVLQWKDKLDTAESAGTEEKNFTYIPSFSKASDLVDSIQKLYGLSTQKPTLQGTQTATGAQAAPTATALSTPGTPTAAQAASAQASASSASRTYTQGIKIAADDRHNVVILMATPSLYKNLLSLLRDLDTPPRQVLIEATIAELTLDKSNSLGFEGYLKGRMSSGAYTASTLGQLGVDTTSGFLFQYLADSSNIQALVNMLAVDKKIEILSKPHILVMDNQEAAIQIGYEIPLVSSEVGTNTTTTTNQNILRNITYTNTGVLMRLKPTINSSGLVTIDVSQEVSEAQTNNTSTIDSPLILTRKITTSVVAANGQTIVLGGIRSKNVNTSETKIPLLGDIPLLGYLFKNASSDVTKTELIILITPRILIDTNETSDVTNQIKNEFIRMTR
ncbi:MAG: hypothetical protein HQK89_07185 [Nitrospirae bacterium]|nr:hypothetical protein [Nitrospirota bacterium]